MMHEAWRYGLLALVRRQHVAVRPDPGEAQVIPLDDPAVSIPGGSEPTAGGINYNSLKAMKAMEMLKELEQRFPTNQ